MFDNFITQLAEAYSEAGDRSAGGWAPEAWADLAADSHERAEGVRLLLDIEETDDPEPYPGAAEMCHEIAEGRFTVSRAHSEHPLWTVDQNVDFRIVHDVLGHFAASVAAGFDPAADIMLSEFELWQRGGLAGFDWEGENAACKAHFRLLHSHNARAALFSECLMQTAWAIENGFEGISQKAVQPEMALAKVTGDHDLFDEYKRVVVDGVIR